MQMKHKSVLALGIMATAFGAGAVGAQGQDWKAQGDSNLYHKDGNIAIGRKRPRFPLHVQTNDANRAVLAWNKSPAGLTFGLYARADKSPDGIGVYGYRNSATGTGAGVVGHTKSGDPNAVGVWGWLENENAGSFSAAVLGQNDGTGSLGYGVWGSHAGSGVGVYGTSSGGTGVYGESGTGAGAIGVSLNGGSGVWGLAAGVESKAVYGWGVVGGYSGYFRDGSVWITGEDVGGLDSSAGAGIRLFNDNINDVSQIFVYDYAANSSKDLVLQGPGGLVGISRIPTANRLEVAGSASKSAAGDWLANSDRRIKTEIETIDSAMEVLNRVRLVSFRYTDSYREAHPELDDVRYLNVIAQEFAEIFPNHVQGSGECLDDGSEILQVDTYPITIYTAAAVQELNRRMASQATRFAALESQNEELKRTNEALEDRLATLEAAVAQMLAEAAGSN